MSSPPSVGERVAVVREPDEDRERHTEPERERDVDRLGQLVERFHDTVPPRLYYILASSFKKASV